jgi:predicted nucleotidyltransferase
MWLVKPLDDVLSSGVKIKVLRILALSRAQLNGREISRQARTDPGYTSRVLAELAASGIVDRRDQGRVYTYQLSDGGIALVNRLVELFQAEDRRLRDFVDDIALTLPEAISVILYGSEARGEAHAGSDTDLLIIVQEKTEALDDRVTDVCLALAEKHSLALSWHLVDLQRVAEWEEQDNDFWRNVQEDGLRLHGEPMGRLGRLWTTGRAL